MSYIISVGPPNNSSLNLIFPPTVFFKDVNINIQLTTGYPCESPDCCAIEFVVGKPWLWRHTQTISIYKMGQYAYFKGSLVPSRELTYSKNVIFEDDFPFPKVGYVNSLEGILPTKLTWQWKITIFHRRYVFKWLFFSIVMLVFGCANSILNRDTSVL